MPCKWVQKSRPALGGPASKHETYKLQLCALAAEQFVSRICYVNQSEDRPFDTPSKGLLLTYRSTLVMPVFCRRRVACRSQALR